VFSTCAGISLTRPTGVFYVCRDVGSTIVIKASGPVNRDSYIKALSTLGLGIARTLEIPD